MNSRKMTVVKWVLVSMVAAAAMVGVAYLYFRTSSVLVENLSAASASDVRVELGGETFWEGALAAGESHRAFGIITPDDVGNLVISFSANGVAHKDVFPSGFFARGVYHRLRITPTLEVECQWDGEVCSEAYEALKLTSEN